MTGLQLFVYAKELNISQVKLVDEVPQTEEREDEVDLEAHEVRGTSFVPFLPMRQSKVWFRMF